MFITVSAAFFISLSLIIGIAVKSITNSDPLKKITGEKVGVIEVNGVINDSDRIIEDIKIFRDNNSIKAIVLRIDSPGGGVGASQEIYTAVKKAANKKPVIASFASIAAFGGYYIAAGATGIIANPGTITGSIGVIIGYTNFQKLLEKIGLKPVVIKSGEYKDAGSPDREMTDKEKIFFETFIKNIHSQFIDAVAKGRNIERLKVEEIADGRIYSGQEALRLKLIDKLGNIEDAVEWAGKKGGIKGAIETVYADNKDKFSFIKDIKQQIQNNFISSISSDTSSNIGYLYNGVR